MYIVYASYSPKYDKIYIGQTDDLKRRIIEHNNGLLSFYTKRYKPWEIIYTEEFGTRSEVMKREKQLKTSRGRAFLWEIVNKKYAYEGRVRSVSRRTARGAETVRCAYWC